MTNKKFSIRKLAVGTASVAIGFSASGTIDSTLANDYTNNYTVTTNPSNNYMYNSNNNRNQPLSPEEYTLKQAKEKAITEVHNHNSLYRRADDWNTIENTVSYINKSQSEEEVSSLLQDFKNKSEKLLQDELAKLKNLTSNDLLELNISATDEISLAKATTLNELYTIKGLFSDEFKKYRSDIINPKRENGEKIYDQREIYTYLSDIDSLIDTRKTEKSIFDAESISATTRSKIINSFFRFNGNRLNPANKNELDTLSYSIKILEKLSKNNLVPNIKKEGLEDELVTYLKEGFDFSNYTKAYHLLSVIRSLNEQYEIKNNINNESKPEENKTTPEYELSLSNKKVIAYDFLKGLTYPNLEKLRADIINATEEDIYSLSHKASAIKQINSIKTLNNNEKERYINEILEANLRADLSTIIGKVLENDIIESSNLNDKQKTRLREILNTLAQENYNTFSDIISSALAINEIKDLSVEEKEAFFNEFINKYTSPSTQDIPSLDLETLYKMDVSILINKLSYLTDEDKKLYKEKIFAQKPGFGGAAGVGELEYRVGYFTKDTFLKSSEYTLESIKEFDTYKEAVAKNEELRKKKESEPTFDSKTENADIPFETIYKDDNTLDKGTEVTETEGINGVKEITTTYTVINGIRQDNPKVEEKVTKEKTDKVVRRGTKVTSSETEKSTQNIPFETIYKDDNSLDKGKEVVITEGINGTKEITTTYTVINGIRQDNPKVEEKVTKEKVDKVVKRGTKVSTTTTPELPNNTNKPISSSTNDSKPNIVAPADKPANSSTNDSKPNTVAPADKPANSGTNDSKPNTVAPTDKPANSSTNDSKPNTVAPTDKPVNSNTNDSKPNTVAPTDKPINSNTNDNKPNTVTPADKPADDNSKPTLANITLENINNDISVTLATAETGVKLVTDEVTNPTTLNEVKEKITNENNSITSTTDITNLRVVDLTLEKEGKKYSTNANRTVRIALLNNEKGNEILVYHVKDNGELEELTKEKNNLTITNDSVEFTINHFSKFAIASIKKNIPTPSTNTSEEYNKNKDNRRDLTDIKPSESNQNKILPKTGVSSSSTVLLGATLLSLALISRKLKKN